MEKLEEFERAVPVVHSDKKIFFPIEIYKKVMHYVRAVDGEISGFCKTEVIPDKKYGGNREDDYAILVKDVRIFTQECGPVSTVLSEEAMSQFIVSLFRSRQKPQDWNLWWHSHVDFDTTFSGIDDATIEKLSANSRLISVCFNKFGEWSSRIDEKSVTVEEMPQVVIDLTDCDTPLRRNIRKEVKRKVTEIPMRSIDYGTYEIEDRLRSIGRNHPDYYSDGFYKAEGHPAPREVSLHPYFARGSWGRR